VTGTATATDSRVIRLRFRSPFATPPGRGLLAADPRVRTLCRVLISYPDVRHILPDRVSLSASADLRTVQSVVRFLERQHWLVHEVTVE
jgi:hypothetical protein